jgi:hypothetical protein
LPSADDRGADEKLEERGALLTPPFPREPAGVLKEWDIFPPDLLA